MVAGAGDAKEFLEGGAMLFGDQHIAHPSDSPHCGLVSGAAELLVRSGLFLPFLTGIGEGPLLLVGHVLRKRAHLLFVQIDKTLRALGRIGAEVVKSLVDGAL